MGHFAFLVLWSIVGPRTTIQPRSTSQLVLDSLIAELRHVRTPATLPRARCANGVKSFRRLCDALVAVRYAELTAQPADAHHADELAQRALLDVPKSAAAWYALGLDRLQLVALHALAHEGPLQPLGVSNEAAAGYALVHALELDAALQPAAEALALAPLPPPREGASRLAERVAMLRRVRDILTPQALYGAGRVELAGGSPDSAVADLQLALARGNRDSGVIAIGLARADYLAGHPEAGRAAFLAGAGDSTAAARDLYRKQVAWVASPAELATWDALGAAQRPAWLADFWAQRDVAEGHADGARLAEHFRRYEYALTRYPLLLPGTGRNRVVQNEDEFVGEMHDAIRTSQHEAAGVGQDEGTVEQRDARLQAFEENDHLYGVDSPFHYLPVDQDELDDRGVIYMRHGKPDEVAASGAGHAAMEIWVYHLPTGPLTLQFTSQDFSSSVEATRLVPTLITGNAESRNQICMAAPSICPLGFVHPVSGPSRVSTAAEVVSGQLSPSRIKLAYTRGVAEIQQAATTDDFAHAFTRALHPAVQLLALQHVTDRSGILIPFAIPGDEIDSSGSVDGSPTYAVRFQALAEKIGTGDRVELDTVRTFVSHAALRHGTFLTGFLEFPVAPGDYRMSLVISQSTGRGAVASLDNITVPLSSGALALSDLVLGRAQSGAQWRSGQVTVPLNPLDTWPVGASTTIYYQVSGLIPGAEYQNRFEVFGARDSRHEAPRLSVTFTEQAQRTAMDVSRTVGLGNLAPGQYRVSVTVSAPGQSATTQGWLTITR